MISGLEMAVSQRTLIPKLFIVSDTTFSHFLGTLELSLICSVLLSFISKLSLNCFLPLKCLSDLSLLYLFTIAMSLLDLCLQCFYLQSILTRLNFLKYCFYDMNFLQKTLCWISLPISASKNSSYKLRHKLVPAYQFKFISHFSSTPTLNRSNCLLFSAYFCIFAFAIIPDCNPPPDSVHSL